MKKSPECTDKLELIRRKIYIEKNKAKCNLRLQGDFSFIDDYLPQLSKQERDKFN